LCKLSGTRKHLVKKQFLVSDDLSGLTSFDKVGERLTWQSGFPHQIMGKNQLHTKYVSSGDLSRLTGFEKVG
jgi:hypothetical protein